MGHEIKAIEKCFQAAGINQSELKFTYIIVSKRINTRFFRMNGKPSNPPSGTVVDSDVTLPERYDFFLVSQSVNQGTVNPTSYNVVKDTSGLLPKHIQALTYKLTHLYYNWPGTSGSPLRASMPTSLPSLLASPFTRSLPPSFRRLCSTCKISFAIALSLTDRSNQDHCFFVDADYDQFSVPRRK